MQRGHSRELGQPARPQRDHEIPESPTSSLWDAPVGGSHCTASRLRQREEPHVAQMWGAKKASRRALRAQPAGVGLQGRGRGGAAAAPVWVPGPGLGAELLAAPRQSEAKQSRAKQSRSAVTGGRRATNGPRRAEPRRQRAERRRTGPGRAVTERRSRDSPRAAPPPGLPRRALRGRAGAVPGLWGLRGRGAGRCSPR